MWFYFTYALQKIRVILSPITNLLPLLTYLLTSLLTPCSIGRTKVSVHVRGACLYFVTNPFFKVRSYQHLAQPPQAGGPPVVGSPLLHIQCIRSHPPYCRLLLHPHFVVTWTQLTRSPSCTKSSNTPFKVSPLCRETTWMSLYQIKTDKFTHILLNRHFINAVLTQNVSTLKCINYTPWRWPFKG